MTLLLVTIALESPVETSMCVKKLIVRLKYYNKNEF